MAETSDTNSLARGAHAAADWVVDTAVDIWKGAKADPVHAAEVAAAGACLVGLGAAGLWLRMAGYGIRPMLTRELLQQAAAAEKASAALSDSAPGMAGRLVARDDITGFTSPGPLKLNGLGKLPANGEIERTVLLSDMRARANVSFDTMRSWVQKNAVNGQLLDSDASTSVARLKGGSGVVLRSDLNMSIISNVRGELQIADHASGEATLLDGSFGGSKTVIFPGGKTRITDLDYNEWTRLNRLWYERSAENRGNLSVLNTIVPKGKA